MKDIVAWAVEVGTYRGVFVKADGLEMFFKSVVKSSVCFAAVKFRAEAAREDVNKVRGSTGEGGFDGETSTGWAFKCVCGCV